MSRPYSFQREVLQEIEWFGGRCIVGLPPGCGKTPISLWHAKKHAHGPVVIVCPASLKVHWAREAEKHLKRTAVVLYGKTPDVPRLPRDDNLFVINYDILGVPHSKPTWTSVFLKSKIDLLILDESHLAKEPTAKRSRAVKMLGDAARMVLALSGTPVVSRPMELWHQCRIVQPNLFPNRHEYGLRYCGAFFGIYGWDYSGHSNLKELNTVLINEILSRRRKEEVLKDLPSKTVTVIPVQLSAAGMADYRRAELRFIEWVIENKGKAAAAKAMQAERLVQLTYLRQVVGRWKVPIVRQWAEEFIEDSDENVLVYGHNIKEFLQPLYDSFKGRSVFVYGGVNPKMRQGMYDKFNTDKTCRVLFGHHDVAGVGWSCKSASTVAYGQMAWTPGQHEQCDDRVRGIGRGTGQPVNCLYFVAENTIETDHCRLLQRKKEVVDAVMDGKKTEDLNIFSQLEAAILARYGGKK